MFKKLGVKDAITCKCNAVMHEEVVEARGCKCDDFEAFSIFMRPEPEPNAKVLAELITDTVIDYIEYEISGPHEVDTYVSAAGLRAVERELQKGGVT